jgi:hypothetical protein
LALASASPAHAASPRLSSVDSPASAVQAGHEVRVVAHAKDVDICELRLTAAGGEPLDSALHHTGRADIVWHWMVPDDAGTATWNGDVRCWEHESDLGSPAADGQTAVRVEVAGKAGAAPALVAPGTLVAELRHDKSFLEAAALPLQVLASIVAIITLPLLLGTFNFTRRHARSERSAEMFQRLNSRDYLDNWSRQFKYLRVADEADCIARIRLYEDVPTGNDPLFPADKNDPKALSINSIVATTNFLEEAAILFNAKALDKNLITRGFGDHLIDSYVELWWWIHWRRRGSPAAAKALRPADDESGSFIEYERMVCDMLRRKRESADSLEKRCKRVKVGALCLPQSDAPTDAEWRQCAQLSVLIGSAVKQRGAYPVGDALGLRRNECTRENPTTICLPPLTEITSKDWLVTCRKYEWLAHGIDRVREQGADIAGALAKLGR